MAALAVCSALCVAARVDAVPITGLFNTGVDGTGTPLPAGAIDPHYKMISSDDPAFPGPNALVTTPPLPVAWTVNTSTGQWISPNTIQTQQDVVGPIGNAAGTYIYELTIDLTGLNPSSVSITGSWAVDDIGLIQLNVGSGGGYIPGTTNLGGPGVYTNFTIPAGSPFLPGLNKLDFVVINAAARSTGLHVENLSGNGIPEPSTVALATIGFACLVAVQRRRGRKR